MGVPLWTQTLGVYLATGFAVDDSGNVFATGWIEPEHGNSYYVTQKLNSDGIRQLQLPGRWHCQEQWVAQYNSLGNSKDQAVALAADDWGNVYVTGWSLAFDSGRDYATIKYNALGETQWIVRYNGIGNATDQATAIAVDDAGNVFVTGRSYNGLSFASVTLKYDLTGEEQWVASYSGPNNADDGSEALMLDGNGNIGEPTPDLDLLDREFDSDNDGTARVNMGAYESLFSSCTDIASLDRVVNVTDLLALLWAWGDCPDPCQIVRQYILALFLTPLK